MIDKRELILKRVFAILTTLKSGNATGIQTVVRNRGLLTNENRPALALVDGGERVKLNHKDTSRPGLMPSIQAMSPEIYVLPKSLLPTNLEDTTNKNIGEITNTYRLAVIEAIANDTELKTLLGSNGGISYNGCETDLKSGSALAGELRMDFTLRYAFIVN